MAEAEVLEVLELLLVLVYLEQQHILLQLEAAVQVLLHHQH
jgi:hypothetical protein